MIDRAVPCFLVKRANRTATEASLGVCPGGERPRGGNRV